MNLNRELSLVRAMARGAVTGALATLAMSVVMLAAGRLRIMGAQPPEEIVERGAEAAGLHPTETEENVAASMAHVAFGAGAGVIFGLLHRIVRPPAPEIMALPWALVVWVVSYLGWVPALGILPPAPKDRPGRAWTMLAAHLVFGLALSGLWRASAALTGRRHRA